MKNRPVISIVTIAAVLWLACPNSAQARQSENLLPSGVTIESAGIGAAADAADSNAYAQGTRAINEGRWSDAAAIFSQVASQAGEHADGALYWKAYAQNKLGQSASALNTCGALRSNHPASKWIEDCGALEIEIHAKSGQPVQPKLEQGDDLRLLALATLMQRDEKRALAQIDEILNSSDSSDKLKQGALFILGQHHTDTVFPQIVRASLVVGDVRVSRGVANKHNKDVTWEKAEPGLPIESGYSLVTGNDGRAEIEFEDASTMYLAENSVLMLDQLTTTAGIPHTEVALLSGTATVHVRPYVAGESFLLLTPTDNLDTKYPGVTNYRVSSYTDGIAVTPLNHGFFNSADLALREPLTPGKTIYLKDGQLIMLAGPIQSQDFTAWDQWVETRYSERQEMMAEALKESGLSSPLPGLADMQGKGRFFPCEPYGTCWEPAQSADQKQVAENLLPQSASVDDSSATAPQTATPAATGGKPARKIGFIGKPSPNSTNNSPASYPDMTAFMPCVPPEIRAIYLQGGLPDMRMEPWAWTACHSGEWLYHGNRYVWVVGRRHHHPPFHWARSGSTIVLVPSHPHDVQNHLPVNRTSPVLAVNPKGPHPLERVQLEQHASVELMKEAPREFRAEFVRPLTPAAEPHMVAHSVHDMAAAKGEPARPGVPIVFNPHTQSFTMTQQQVRGGRSVAVSVPINNSRGDLQSRAGSPGAGGGSMRGGASAGSSSGGSRAASSTPSSSAASSSSSVSSSSGSSSGGGSHH
jgi:FecR protein